MVTAPAAACTTTAGATSHNTNIANVKQTDSVDRGRGSSVRDRPNSGTSTTSAATVSAQKPPRALPIANRIASGNANTTIAAATAITHQIRTLRSRGLRSADTFHGSYEGCRA